MRVLLLGATGRTGKLALDKLLKKGHQVHCLARNSSRIKKLKNLKIFEGNPTIKSDLDTAMSGTDFVISTLNISRKTDFPWAPLRTPKNLLSKVMEQLVPIAETNNIKKIVICSAWGVGQSKKDIPKWFRWLINNSNIGWAYKDHENQEEIITQSNLDWTIVRPVGLTNSKQREKIKESFGNNPKPNLLVSRQSVAEFLLESLTRVDLSKKKVVISKK